MLKRAVTRLAPTHRRTLSGNGDWRTATVALATLATSFTALADGSLGGQSGSGNSITSNNLHDLLLKQRRRDHQSPLSLFLSSSTAVTSTTTAATSKDALDDAADAHSNSSHGRRRDWFAGLRVAYRVVYRTTELTILFLPLAVSAPFAFEKIPFQKRLQRLVASKKTNGPEDETRRRHHRLRRRRRWYASLRRRLERAGPAFIKWGQWASTRFDRFPPALCSQLQRLQQRAPAHDWTWSRDTLERLFGVGAHLGGVFEWVEETPIASGSIAQVHRAKLRHDWMPPNHEVAVEEGVEVGKSGKEEEGGRVSSGEGGSSYSYLRKLLKRWAAAAEWALTRGGWRTAAAARSGSVVAVKVRHPVGMDGQRATIQARV